MTFRSFAFASALLLIACAGDGPPTEPDGKLPSSYRDVEGCSEPLWVPGGVAWYGHYTVAFNPFAVTPLPCETNLITQSFTTLGFFLDREETTRSCYDACVAQGSCPALEPSSSPGDFPATVTDGASEAICAFRGGRLPSVVELSRAAQGEESTPAPIEVLEVVVQCQAEGWTSESCKKLFERGLTGLDQGQMDFPPTQAVRSEPRDVGPFGHFDLFGSQAELTQTFENPDDAVKYGEVCALPGESRDPKTFGELTRQAYFPATVLFELNRMGTAPEGVLANPTISASTGRLKERLGVRCAFDPDRE